MMGVHFSVFVLALLNIANSPVLAFNVDTYNYIQYEVKPNSSFGFSVALHKEDSKGWVLIGAPKAQSTQPDVKQGGVVYKCDISDDNRCEAVPFDINGNHYNRRKEQIDTKSHQWFGATVTSAGINGPIVACAPRYVFHTMKPKLVERVDPVGTCYLLKNNFTNSQEISPCRTRAWGYHRQGSCHAGLSAAVTKDGRRLFIGAPGSWYWQRQVYSTNLNNPENKVYSTGENTTEDDSYRGYSMTTGDFDGDGIQDVAVGVPRGGELLGKVQIFTWDMVNQGDITGEQIGAYFGYSLCAVDVDGDGFDDLLIGAPMYTKPNNAGKYEMGRVYIKFQGKTDKFKILETRDRMNSRGRFGLALASLGDMNLDGFGDFAVGAPYDGPNNKGAVYIYHGSKTGPLAKYSQVIYAEDLRIPFLSTFGFSISGGLDLDGNLYPDLVVGAYESSPFYVKSRPVAVVEASTVFLAESKLISLDIKNCKTPRDRKEVPCTRVKSCLKYNGENVPTSLYLDVSWALDSKKPKSPRMFFLNDEGKNIKNSTITLYRGKLECREEEVYITDNIRDKLTPLEVEMRYNLIQSDARRKRATPGPVIDSNLGLIKRDSINIQRRCGPDNVCIPDLRLSIKTVDQYLVGSRDLLTIDVNISNYGEDAFQARFYMNMPQDLIFKKIERIGDMRDTSVSCTPPSPASNNMLKCGIGNPLSAGRFAKFKVIMIPSQKTGMAPSYDFYMEANSTNPESESSRSDNVIKQSIGIWIETDLSIEGTSIPHQQIYDASEFKSFQNATVESDLGPQVVHMYNIRNNGPSTIQEAEVYVLWPYETREGDFLMYLLNQPETSGNIQCTPTAYANQRDLRLDSKLSRKSYLESSGAVSRVNNAAWYDRHQGVYTEHSSSSSRSSSSSLSSSSTSDGKGSYATGRGSVVLTGPEKNRIIEEEPLESKGDASYIRNQLDLEAATSTSTDSRAFVEETSGQRSGVSTRQRMKRQQNGEPSRPDLVTGATSLEEMAQVGHGFNRRNIDDELRRYSGESTGYYSQSGQWVSGGRAGGSGSGSNYYSQTGSRTGSIGGTNYYSQSSHSEPAGGPMSGYRTHSSSGSAEAQRQDENNYGPGSQSDLKLTLYPRVRRQIGNMVDDQDRQLEKALHCVIVHCAAIRCTVGPLANEEEAWIAIRTRLIAATMRKLAPNVPMNISTKAVSRVTKLPYIGTPKEMPIKSHEILFTATPEPITKPDVVSLWVVILSACAGAITLLLLVFLLYKCGFFNRKRPSDSSQQQALNGNENDECDENL